MKIVSSLRAVTIRGFTHHTVPRYWHTASEINKDRALEVEEVWKYEVEELKGMLVYFLVILVSSLLHGLQNDLEYFPYQRKL